MKSPEKKWRTNNWFLLHDNVPAHQSDLTDDFLAKNNVTTLEHHPYSPDVATTDFCLFPLLKVALKVRRVCNDTTINKNAKEELKRLSKISFENVSNNSIVAGRSLYLYKGIILKEI
jgi:hypothetical protein